jgi:signal transduction histidine kinase
VNIDDKTAARANVVPGTYAMLSVRDTGCGMDAQTVKKIFDPFFSTKPRGAGSGLGLTSAREIIQKHGGAISVESTPNIGTLFVIFLPLADE